MAKKHNVRKNSCLKNLSTVVWLVLAGYAISLTAALPAAVKPNILLILTDDQGWGDVHAHGNDLIDTPVMDRLSREGARFDRFYVSPVCAPTRASLLTGRYHLRGGVSGVTHRQEVLHAEEVTLAEVFKAAGYATGIFGKWHNGEQYPNHPNGQGFDEFLGFCGGHWNTYFDPELQHNGQPVKTKGFITDILTDAALQWIDQNQSHPFFCYVPYNAPHTPWQVPDRYFDKYKARGLSNEAAAAYGLCESLDDNIGRLLAKLADLQLANNTIVLFLTDNGPNAVRYNGGMKGKKGSVNEGGIRVPLFIRWPGHLQPRLVPQIAAHIDLLPTLVELCGVPMLKTLPLDGRSLVPLLQGEAKDWPDRTLFAYQPDTRGELPLEKGTARTQQYRLVREKSNVCQLYDMIADPSQKQNIAAQHPDIVQRLNTAYEAWFSEARKGALEKPPIPVGHPQSPLVRLPAPEAGYSGNVEFFNKPGFSHDWLSNWTSLADRIWWDLEVAQAGRYEVTLLYSCPPKDIGSTIRAEAGGQSVKATLTQPFDTGVIERPERVEAQLYRWMREFAPLKMGVVRLGAGRTRLSLQATKVAGEKVAEVGAVQLRRVE
jgi:arylsulfatase A